MHCLQKNKCSILISYRTSVLLSTTKTKIAKGVFDKAFSKNVDSAFRLREKADYEDFYIVSIEDAKAQIGKAKVIIQLVEEYVRTRWQEV